MGELFVYRGPTITGNRETQRTLMKKLLFLALSTILLLISCKKEEIPGPDYREQYVGTYQCSGTYSSYNDLDGYQSGSSSTLLEVSIHTGTDSTIVVGTNIVRIDENGDYTTWYGTTWGGQGYCPHNTYVLNFDDQGNVVYEYDNVAPGGWSSYEYTGVRL